MNNDLQQRWTSRWEGVRNHVYHDTKGIPTIGVGINLLTSEAKRLVAQVGANYEDILFGNSSLTSSQVDELFSYSLRTAVSSATALVPGFDSLPEGPQIVLTDLAFNLGQARLAKFTNTISSFNHGKFSDAATGLKQSLWFSQVGEGIHQRGGANVAVLSGTHTIEQILAT